MPTDEPRRLLEVTALIGRRARRKTAFPVNLVVDLALTLQAVHSSR